MLRGLLGGFARGRRQTSAATLVLDFLAGLNDSRITYSGGTNGTRVNSSGNIVAATTPRFDYDPVTLAAKGLLVEEARTNVAFPSVGFSTGSWGSTGVTVTAGSVTGPDGTASGAKLQATVADASTALFGVVATQNTAYAYSVYLRADTPTTVSIFMVDTGGGSGSGSQVCNVTTSWQRFTLLRTTSASTTSCVLQIGGAGTFSTGEIVYAWGAQLEAGSFPTSYIPTTSAAVTRTADSAVMTGTNFSSWYNQSEGTFVVIATSAPAIGSVAQATLEVDDTTVNNRHVLFRDGAGFISAQTGAGGVIQSFLVGAAWSSSTLGKQAFSYKADDFAMSFNAATPITDASGSVPTVTQMVIGNTAPGNRNFNGHIRTLQYYPRRVSNEQLQALTA